MTHLRNVERRNAEPRGRVEQTVLEQAGKLNAPLRSVTRTVHVVACDCKDCGSATHKDEVLQGGEWVVVRHPCSHEYTCDPIPDHEWYVPLGWGIYSDGTHRCPDCRTKAAVERDHKEQQEIQRGFENQYGEACVNCGRTWDEHHHPELRHPEACGQHVHGRELARPLYKVRQHALGLKNWDEMPEEHHHVGHIVTFGADREAARER